MLHSVFSAQVHGQLRIKATKAGARRLIETLIRDSNINKLINKIAAIRDLEIACAQIAIAFAIVINCTALFRSALH